MPTVASMRPIQAAMKPLRMDLATTTTIAESPKSARSAYSAGPKLRAARASNGEIKMSANTPNEGGNRGYAYGPSSLAAL